MLMHVGKLERGSSEELESDGKEDIYI